MSTVTKWQLEQDEMVRRRLGKTIEECSELSKICTRILLQGIGECDPVTAKANLTNLMEEIADVYAQCDETVKALGLGEGFIAIRRERKSKSMQEWEAMYKHG